MSAKPDIIDNVEAFAPRVRVMPPRRPRCAFRAGESTFYPFIDEIVRIQARRNYSEVFVTGGNFIVREVLVSLERRLAQFGFYRVQRSSIINLGRVVEIRRERRGKYAVVLTDGSTVIVPAAVRERLEQLLAG